MAESRARSTIYCSTGNNWSICAAQKWDCTPDLVEELYAQAQAAVPAVPGDNKGALRNERAYQVILNWHGAMRLRGLKPAAYCDTCGKMIMDEDLKARQGEVAA